MTKLTPPSPSNPKRRLEFMIANPDWPMAAYEIEALKKRLNILKKPKLEFEILPKKKSFIERMFNR